MERQGREVFRRVAVLLLSLFAVDALQAEQFTLGLSYQFETGDYGSATSTDVETIPLTLKYYADVWSFGAELAYVSVSGDEAFIPGTTSRGFGRGPRSGGITTTSSTSSVSRSGMGDSRVFVARAFFPEQKGDWFYELTASIKLATADDRRSLGTGEVDYSIKLASSTRLGRWIPGITLGYQLTGDSAVTDFNDVLFFSLGSGYALGRYSTLGFGYDFQQAVSNGVDDFAAISLTYSYETGGGIDLSASLKAGLSDNSLDKGLALAASIPF